jgi:hypothetical protein
MMSTCGRREFLALFAVMAPALACSTGPAETATVPSGLPELPGESVFGAGDSGGFVVYEARSLAPLHAGSSRLGLAPRTAAASVAKTFCAYAALRNGLLGADEVLLCDGDGYKPEGHGRLAVVEALALSCNAFFEKAGARLTWEQFREACRRLGDLEDRLPDKPPNLLERLDVYAHGSGVGTGFDELGRIARAIAFADPGDAALSLVRRGWREAVTRGTARAADVEGLEVAGKTGTLPDPPWERKFASFAPVSEPQWVVAARTAGRDGASAAAIAGRVFRKLRTLKRGA